MDIGYKTETLVIAGMIENEQTILALARPQPAPDRLDKPNARLCWPCINYTSDIQVYSCVQCCYIANKLCFTGSKPIEYFLAFEQRGITVDIFGADSGLDEPLLQMPGMPAIDAIAKGLPVLAFSSQVRTTSATISVVLQASDKSAS